LTRTARPSGRGSAIGAGLFATAEFAFAGYLAATGYEPIYVGAYITTGTFALLLAAAFLIVRAAERRTAERNLRTKDVPKDPND
jgi:hypothetical protein